MHCAPDERLDQGHPGSTRHGPTAQLAKRLGVAQPTVAGLEGAEASKAIASRRSSERRARDCTLVYALVPRKSLESLVQERAHQAARKRLHTISHSMALENQRVSKTASAHS